jgi:hypothetical protein
MNEHYQKHKNCRLVNNEQNKVEQLHAQHPVRATNI